jgi:hypothetical protein
MRARFVRSDKKAISLAFGFQRAAKGWIFFAPNCIFLLDLPQKRLIFGAPINPKPIGPPTMKNLLRDLAVAAFIISTAHIIITW